MSGPSIRAIGVDMIFPTRKGPLTALEGFDLEVNAGEVVCMVGDGNLIAQQTLHFIRGAIQGIVIEARHAEQQHQHEAKAAH